MDELLSLKWKNHSSTFLHVLGIIRKDQTYSDVTLTCSGKFYSAHKFVLTACSDYFKEIFDHTDCKKPVIVLKGMMCEDLEVLLDYMYLGEVNVKQCDITSLIKAAECLQIKGLAVADDEPQTQTKPSKRNSSSPTVKSKRKHNDSHYQSSGPKHFKADSSKFSKSNESKNLMSKIEPIDEVKPVFIKEEISDDFTSVHVDEHPFTEQECKLQDDQLSSQNYMAQPSSSERQESFLSRTQDELSSTFQDDPSEWPDESTMDYPSYNEFDDPNTPGQANKKKSHYDAKICPYCSKDFGYESKLKNHILVHTGEKPFSCDLCPYKSNQKNNLKTHMIRHQQFQI